MTRPSRASRLRWLPLALLPAAVAEAGDDAPPGPPLAVVCRTIAQDRCAWQTWRIDYQLRNEGKAPLVIAPAEVSAKVEGWVSNSRVANHAIPRRSSVVASGLGGLSAYSEVIPSSDEDHRCRERLVLQVWPAAAGDEPPDPIAKAKAGPVLPEAQPTWTIAPGAQIRARLRLEHVHFVYGPHDPLLGPREVELHLGAAALTDLLPLDRERRLPPTASGDFPCPPSDRLDRRVYFSAPDSLHLESHVPGNQLFRLERPVRYGTRVRLRYWYLIAPGTEGECRAEIRQFKDASISRALPDGCHEQTLTTFGRWTRVERVFRTEPEATSLALEFRITGSSDVGEMWIDDVSLEPLGQEPKAP